MIDWTTVSALATGLGTLVLAVATFAAVRSANRAARAAERSLLRPVSEERWLASVTRHWNVDRPDPR